HELAQAARFRRAPNGRHQLFARLDDEHAAEARGDPGADTLPGRRRAQQYLAPERRKKQRSAPVERREHSPDQELVELPAAIGTAMAEGRLVEARPHATPVRHDEDHAALRRQHAPHLAQELPRAVSDLEAMYGEQ